jgi:hypothetical protein
MLYKLENTVTAVLFVNCKGLDTDKQFLNVEEKFTTFTFKSNKVDGTLDKAVQLLKQDVKSVAFGTLSNKPDGIDVIGVNANVFEKIDAFGE